MTLRHHQGRARHSIRAALGLTPPRSPSRRAGDGALYFIVFLLLLTWQKACAQLAPADDFFNRGAQLYISNNVPAALEQVQDGLKTYPDDEKLKKLEQLLKQQQQQQQQQQNQNQNQSQQQKSQPQQKQSSQDNSQQQQEQEQQKQEDEKQKEAERQKEEQQKQQESPPQSAQKNEQKEKPESGQQVQAGQMTPEEAKRLLDAQKGDEQLLQWKPKDKRNAHHSVKDW
jgi:Ca-activated chloride channel homolog